MESVEKVTDSLVPVPNEYHKLLITTAFEKIKARLGDQEIEKIIIVPDKIINFVLKR